MACHEWLSVKMLWICCTTFDLLYKYPQQIELIEFGLKALSPPCRRRIELMLTDVYSTAGALVSSMHGSTFTSYQQGS